jgi:hypothetical protein
MTGGDLMNKFDEDMFAALDPNALFEPRPREMGRIMMDNRQKRAAALKAARERAKKK